MPNLINHFPSAADTKNELMDMSDVEGQTTVLQQTKKHSFLATVFTFLRSRSEKTLRKDLAAALSDKAGSDVAFSPEERAMLHNILRLKEIRVEDVMIPRADIKAIDITATLDDALEMFEESTHSRMPVYADTLDDPRGMIHIRDILSHITRSVRQKNGRHVSSRRKMSIPVPKSSKLDLSRLDLTKTIGELKLMRKVLFVPPSMMASGLMARMQASHIQMALVIDEYGGTDGLVSLEDIVEMVVGDIEDEHDDDEVMIVQEADGVFVVDARADLDEVITKIGPGFVVGEHGEDVDTVGGLIFSVLGRIPVRGEVVHAVRDYEFHVLEADPRRIRKVRIVPLYSVERRRRPSLPIKTEQKSLTNFIEDKSENQPPRS